jgi:hypothetical protein
MKKDRQQNKGRGGFWRAWCGAEPDHVKRIVVTAIAHAAVPDVENDSWRQ